jgi:hypothetical protein
VISTIYWTLLTLLPALILPPRHERTMGEPGSVNEMLMLFRLPLFLDLTLHASPVLALLVDFLFLERRYSQRALTTTAPSIAILYGVGYSCFVEYCASFNGHCKGFTTETFVSGVTTWLDPYPFLDVSLKSRLAIYTAATMVALFSFRGLNSIHR